MQPEKNCTNQSADNTSDFPGFSGGSFLKGPGPYGILPAPTGPITITHQTWKDCGWPQSSWKVSYPTATGEAAWCYRTEEEAKKERDTIEAALLPFRIKALINMSDERNRSTLNAGTKRLNEINMSDFHEGQKERKKASAWQPRQGMGLAEARDICNEWIFLSLTRNDRELPDDVRAAITHLLDITANYPDILLSKPMVLVSVSTDELAVWTNLINAQDIRINGLLQSNNDLVEKERMARAEALALKSQMQALLKKLGEDA